MGAKENQKRFQERKKQNAIIADQKRNGTYVEQREFETPREMMKHLEKTGTYIAKRIDEDTVLLDNGKIVFLKDVDLGQI